MNFIPAVGVAIVWVFTHEKGVLHGKMLALWTAIIEVGSVALKTGAPNTIESKAMCIINQ